MGNYCFIRVLLYAKMLKETETEKHRLFCHISIIGVISIGVGAVPPGPPLAMSTAMFWLCMSGCWALSTAVSYGKSSPGYCIRFIKKVI